MNNYFWLLLGLITPACIVILTFAVLDLKFWLQRRTLPEQPAEELSEVEGHF